MGRFPSEEKLGEVDDPDLGRLELWGVHKHRTFKIGKPQIDFTEWRGALAGLPLILGVDFGDAPEKALGYLTSEARAALRALPDRLSQIRDETAERELATARDWANDPNLSAERLAESLQASTIDLYADAEDASILIYFDDTANIFAGHMITTTLNTAGAVTHTALEG